MCVYYLAFGLQYVSALCVVWNADTEFIGGNISRVRRWTFTSAPKHPSYVFLGEIVGNNGYCPKLNPKR
jgi:hypothetical protein